MEKLIRKKGLKERELLTWQLQTANEKMAEQEKREKVDKKLACKSFDKLLTQSLCPLSG